VRDYACARQAHLEDLANRLRADGIEVTHSSALGNIASGSRPPPSASRSTDVMGTHGRSSIAHVLLGSVTEIVRRRRSRS
jgi:hypothetical protein